MKLATKSLMIEMRNKMVALAAIRVYDICKFRNGKSKLYSRTLAVVKYDRYLNEYSDIEALEVTE